MNTPIVPADLDDDAAWAEYVAALPEPTDAELAAVLTEHANPYAEQVAGCHEGFRASARMILDPRADRAGRRARLGSVRLERPRPGHPGAGPLARRRRVRRIPPALTPPLNNLD